MNTLSMYPKKIRKEYIRNIKNSGTNKSPEQYHNILFKSSLILTIISFFLFYFININLGYTFLVFVIVNIFFYLQTGMKASSRIKKMEEIFPDVISLMASNLRAGITIDKSFLLSARPEFYPLDKEILAAGNEISTGKDIVSSLREMVKRIDSKKIEKIIMLIISGLRAGGNIADLLEETSRNMKEKEILEKKTASTTLMYVIFIFFAVSVGAPALFGLSSVLVEIVLNLTSKMPDMSGAQSGLPFTFSSISISLNFIIYFSIVFIIVTDFISCFIIGIVSKGDSKSGLKFFFPILGISLTIFFLIRTILGKILMSTINSF